MRRAGEVEKQGRNGCEEQHGECQPDFSKHSGFDKIVSVSCQPLILPTGMRTCVASTCGAMEAAQCTAAENTLMLLCMSKNIFLLANLMNSSKNAIIQNTVCVIFFSAFTGVTGKRNTGNA